MSNANTGKTVYFTLDPKNPPKLSDEETERLRGLKDEDIDFSDIPSTSPDARWLPGRFSALTRDGLVSVDQDLREFYDGGEGVVARDKVNAVLREYAAAHRKQA